MCTPCSVAMKPRIEKTTKPAKKLVPLLMSARMIASLGVEGQDIVALSSSTAPGKGKAGPGRAEAGRAGAGAYL